MTQQPPTPDRDDRTKNPDGPTTEGRDRDQQGDEAMERADVANGEPDARTTPPRSPDEGDARP